MHVNINDTNRLFKILQEKFKLEIKRYNNIQKIVASKYFELEQTM